MRVKQGIISFNGRVLNLIGTPTLSVNRKPDPPAPATATRTLISFDLSIQIERHSASGVTAAMRELEQVFQRGEGILRVEDETGYAREWMAAPQGGNPTQEIAGRGNAWRVELTASAAHSAGNLIEEFASITPLLPEAGTEIFLHNIRDASVSIGTERHSPRFAARSLTTTSTTLTARVFHADPITPFAERMKALHDKAMEYEALNTAQALLKFMGKESMVQVQELRPVVDERKEVLDLVIQCKSYDLPGEQKVEANYQKSNNKDISSGDNITSIRGNIQADSYEDAFARLNAIRNSHTTEQSRLTKFNHTAPYVIGSDTQYTDAWSGSIDFDMEFRTQDDKCEGYEIKISSDQDANGSYKRSYSGFVTATSISAATAKAHELGWNKHPNWSRQNETTTEINAMGANDTCTRTFIRLDFTYDYDLVADYIHSEFTMTRSKVSYGDRTASISGSITAATKQIADDFQSRVIPLLLPESSGLTPAELESRITSFQCVETTRTKAEAPSYAITGEFIRREIQFGIRVWDRGESVHVKYRKSDSINITTMQCVSAISGTIWADTEAKARAEYAALKSAMGISITQEKTDVDLEKAKGANPNFIEFTFSAEGVCKLTGVVGVDLLEVQWTLERKGQYNHTAISEIPFRKPIAQQNVGWTTGQMRLSGQVRAVKLSTAISYAQGKIPLILGGAAYETEAPVESVTPTMLPLSGTEVSGYSFSFSYSRTFTSGLEGLFRSTASIGV